MWMKQARCKIFLCMLAAGLATGCSAEEMKAQPPAGASVTKEQLLHHNFVLTSIDGKAFTGKEQVPSIEFNEGFHVSGGVCNRFMGQGTLENGVLRIEKMASTMMMCPDQKLNELESTFAAMMGAGAAISLEGKVLTLKEGNRTLVYTLKDYVK